MTTSTTSTLATASSETLIDTLVEALVAQAMATARATGSSGPKAASVWYAYLVPEARALIDELYVA